MEVPGGARRGDPLTRTSRDPAGAAAFLPTRWSVVARAAEGSDAGARAALEDLCRAYWYPLYAFLRRGGRADAADLVQGFFARAIEKGWFGQADPERGRFRTFLLAALKHHVSHEAERACALRRGGGRPVLSLDVEDAERRYGREPASPETPESLFERRWALEVLDRALARTAERARSGPPERAERFEALRPLLWDEGPPQREVANRLGMSETAVKVALHRLRAQVREDLRAEVLDTLADPADLEGEIRRLAAALRGAAGS